MVSGFFEDSFGDLLGWIEMESLAIKLIIDFLEEIMESDIIILERINEIIPVKRKRSRGPLMADWLGGWCIGGLRCIGLGGTSSGLWWEIGVGLMDDFGDDGWILARGVIWSGRV